MQKQQKTNESHDQSQSKVGSNNSIQDKNYALDDLPKFHKLPMTEFYGSEVFNLIQDGLKEIAQHRPENPIKYLGEYLVKKS
ncbi:hypothetical protein pb186bvf_012553 [Paramecium bursaria]